VWAAVVDQVESAPAPAPAPSRRRRLGVLAICCLSLLIVGLDSTIVNVALPDIGRDLDASVSGLQWTLDAYTIVIASLLMLAGSTADRIGRRKVFQAGLVLFAVGSLLCSVAPGLGWLVAFRMVQAVGGSMLNPVAMSIITNTFTEPRERAQAIGVWGGVVGLSMALGPLVGGLLVGTVGWRSIFWINIPVALAALVLTWRFVPESRAGHARRPDPLGQLFVLAFLTSLTYGIIEGPGAGWTSARILGALGLATVALAALLGYEPRRREPLLELRFFRDPPFSGAVAIAVCAFASLAGFLFLSTIYLQEARGLSALHAGLYLLPLAGMTVLIAPLSGRIVGRRGPRLGAPRFDWGAPSVDLFASGCPSVEVRSERQLAAQPGARAPGVRWDGHPTRAVQGWWRRCCTIRYPWSRTSATYCSTWARS
jgi:EmrB/QacA subfamily drug resistance transporter